MHSNIDKTISGTLFPRQQKGTDPEPIPKKDFRDYQGNRIIISILLNIF